MLVPHRDGSGELVPHDGRSSRPLVGNPSAEPGDADERRSISELLALDALQVVHTRSLWGMMHNTT